MGDAATILWFVAGVAVGLTIAMLAFALISAADWRRHRKKVRRAPVAAALRETRMSKGAAALASEPLNF